MNDDKNNKLDLLYTELTNLYKDINSLLNYIEVSIDRKLTDEEHQYVINNINNPVIYTNTDNKNKFKNEIFLNNIELLGITSKNSYLDNKAKCVFFDKDNILNKSINNNTLINLYFIIDCLKNNTFLNFSECIDYNVESPYVETEFQCKKCNSKNIIPKEEHNRALDEASLYFLKCEDCGNKFNY